MALHFQGTSRKRSGHGIQGVVGLICGIIRAAAATSAARAALTCELGVTAFWKPSGACGLARVRVFARVAAVGRELRRCGRRRRWSASEASQALAHGAGGICSGTRACVFGVGNPRSRSALDHRPTRPIRLAARIGAIACAARASAARRASENLVAPRGCRAAIECRAARRGNLIRRHSESARHGRDRLRRYAVCRSRGHGRRGGRGGGRRTGARSAR
jgi:hypothetical protein